MLTIAGGILLAVLILQVLPYIVVLGLEILTSRTFWRCSGFVLTCLFFVVFFLSRGP